MTSQEIFSLFCKFIETRVFSSENAGSYVSFVVDASVIQEFCKQKACEEKALINAVRSQLYPARDDISTIMGILAIQLYAASKRKNSDGVTVKNYRERLSQVLDWDMNDLQSWMVENQELYWESLYKWCDKHYFYITKCERKKGVGRYTQYPVTQALRVFTEEDLNYIAAAFFDEHLQPGEDIQERDFWNIVGKSHIKTYIITHHGKEVLEHSHKDEDYYSQIFNYYLRWNGAYKKQGSPKPTVDNDKSNQLLYLNHSFQTLDIRTTNLSLVTSIQLDSITIDELGNYYTFKREGVILFKKDDIYDDMWIETRFLEEDCEGIAVCFKSKANYLSMSRNHLLFENYKVAIYRISKSYSTKDLYTQKRFYRLEGGLKVRHNAYLQQACPLLKLDYPVRFWLDGSLIDNSNLVHRFNHLEPGYHNIKFQNFKRIEFEVISLNASSREWMSSYNKWMFDRKTSQWESGKFETGAVGLDFAYIPYAECEPKKTVLNRWAFFALTGEINRDENNIGINLLRKIQ